MAKKQKATKKSLALTKSKAKPRRLKIPRYRSLKLSKRIKHPAPKLPNVLRLFQAALVRLKKGWRLFGGIILIYGLLTIILVRGFGGGLNLGGLKDNLHQLSQGRWSQLSTGVTLFGVLLGSAGSSANGTASIYQTILMIVISLVLIWSLRQQQANNKITMRSAFYNSMYPLIPFLLVLMVIGLQLIPLAIGSSIFNLVITNGIAVSFIEKFVWGLLFFCLSLLSLYMLSSSIFALYIVTLPDMTPLRALRSARQLVRYRRWTVLRKIVLLPVLLLLAAGVIMVPLIILLTSLAQWIFFICTMAALAIIHSYVYTLYRELL